MRLDLTPKCGGMLVYIVYNLNLFTMFTCLVYKSSLPSGSMSNFKLPENIQVIPFELNLCLFASVYKPSSQSNNYFLDTSNGLLDF